MPVDLTGAIESNLIGIGAPAFIPPSALAMFNGKIPIIWDIPGLSSKIPPLVMYINPEEVSTQRTPAMAMISTITQDVSYYYGMNPTEISMSGYTGLFYHPLTGIVDVLRIITPAYKYFHKLFEIYRNNGLVQDTKSVVMFWRPITLTYEDRIYKGYFKSFDYTDSGDTPYGFKYSITFTALDEEMSAN